MRFPERGGPTGETVGGVPGAGETPLVALLAVRGNPVVEVPVGAGALRKIRTPGEPQTKSAVGCRSRTLRALVLALLALELRVLEVAVPAVAGWWVLVPVVLRCLEALEAVVAVQVASGAPHAASLADTRAHGEVLIITVLAGTAN